MHRRPQILADVRAIFYAAVDSVKPQNIFQKCVQLTENQLTIRTNTRLEHFNIGPRHKIHVVGFGKAVYGMAVQIEKILSHRLSSGIISVPMGTKVGCDLLQKFEVLEGAENNLPDERAFEASKKIVERCSLLGEDDILICLISGGGSALLPYPKDPLTLQEKLGVIKDLANRGGTIEELNTVRIALSEVKGGRLAEKAKKAHLIISLVISDIIGDPLELIASGPTLEQKSDGAQNALRVLKKYGITDSKIEDIVQQYIPVTSLPNVHNFIVTNNQIAINKAIEHALSLGYSTHFHSRSVQGNVETTCELFQSLFDKFSTHCSASSNGICIISGGETTVHVRGSGKGGRNQELALRFALYCTQNGIKNAYLLSGGTDGFDGPTPAAGAIGCYFDDGIAKIEEHLATNDSYHFYEQYSPSTHLVTGHTGTNVMDLHILLIKLGEK